MRKPSPPKRKRARRGKARKADAACEEKPIVSDALIERTYRWLERHETPRIFAAVAREIGYTGARARDFFCGCAPHYAKGLPVCEGAREACPFAGRLTAEEIAANDSAAARRSVDQLINRLIAARYAASGASTL